MPSPVESGPSLSPVCCRRRPRRSPIAVSLAPDPRPSLSPSPSPPPPSLSLSLPPTPSSTTAIAIAPIVVDADVVAVAVAPAAPDPSASAVLAPAQIPSSLKTLPPSSRYATSPPLSPPPNPSCSPSPFAAMLTPHPAESRPTSVSPPPPRPNQSPVHAEPRSTHHLATRSPAIHPRRCTHQTISSYRRAHQTSPTEAAGRLLAPPRYLLYPVQPVASPPHPSSSRPRRRPRLQPPLPRRASTPPPLLRSPRVPTSINNLVVPSLPTLSLHPAPPPAPRLCLNRPPRDYPLELQLP
jgi:hypothetical protein